MTYTEKKFNLPTLDGLSKESVDAHLALYAGYVKNFNAITTLLADLGKDPEKNAHAIAELVRRLPFEFDGMRLHEYYFSQWEGGPAELSAESPLHLALAAQFGTYEAWEKEFKSVCAMRGPGWAILYWDSEGKMFHKVWEHAFVADYGTTGRGKYIDACLKNYNWSVMEERFAGLGK